MDGLLHYEDFVVGARYELGSYTLTRDDVIAYATEFDPQPFHLDEAAAKASLLGGLAASGWQNCAILMRIIADGYLKHAAGLGSNGMSEVKWLRPVFAGETLSGHMTVLDKRVSRSRPEMGILTCKWVMTNAADEVKVEQTGVNFMRVRTP